jgi:DNA-binding transcriptional LysR family regulator
MSRLGEAEVFVAVVDAGGFTAAARALGMTQPAVSRRVTALEARLGTRLLVRSTRRLRLTDAGEAFYERSRVALAELEDAECAAAAEGTELRGRLRLTSPPAFSRAVLVPHLAAFSAAHPAISVELLLTERRLDLADEGIDLAVRIADPGQRAGLVQTRLTTFTMIACAAQSYLSARGNPRAPADLARHACLVQSGSLRHDTWRFERGGKWTSVQVQGALSSNDVDALRLAARAGMGIALLPSFLAEADIRTGALRPLLGRFSSPRIDVYAVYGERRHLPARVRALLDFLVSCLRRGSAPGSK